jgi:hypothetical protein
MALMVTPVRLNVGFILTVVETSADILDEKKDGILCKVHKVRYLGGKTTAINVFSFPYSKRKRE